MNDRPHFLLRVFVEWTFGLSPAWAIITLWSHSIATGLALAFLPPIILAVVCLPFIGLHWLFTEGPYRLSHWWDCVAHGAHKPEEQARRRALFEASLRNHRNVL